MAREERKNPNMAGFSVENGSTVEDAKPIESKKETRYVYDDKVKEESGSKTKIVTYHGKDSAVNSSSHVKATKNDFASANYAFMIYDKNKDVFRLVPIQKHLYFEK